MYIVDLSQGIKYDSITCQKISEIKDGEQQGNVKIDVDSSISGESNNPVASSAIYNALQEKENTTNKVTTIDASSNDTQYPSAKAVYDKFLDVDSSIEGIYNDISEFGGEIEQLIDDVSTNTSQSISGLAQTIEDVSTNTSQSISGLAQTIEDVSTNLSQKTLELNQSIEDVSTNTSQSISDLEQTIGDVSTNTTQKIDNDSYVIATSLVDLNTKKENISNKVTTIDASSNDTQYPSAKAVYDKVHKLDSSIQDASSNISSLRQTVGDVSTNVSNLKQDVDDVSTNINNLNKTIDDVSTNTAQSISEVKQSIKDVSTNVSDLEQMIREGIVIDASINIPDDIEESLSNLEQAIEDVSANVSDIEQMIREGIVIDASINIPDDIEEDMFDIEKSLSISYTELKRNKEDVSNKVTSLNALNTDVQYPSAKAVYDKVNQLAEQIGSLLSLNTTQKDSLVNAINELVLNKADSSTAISSNNVRNIVVLTEDEYENLEEKLPNTEYNIVED